MTDGYTYRISETADDVFRDHLDRLAARWGQAQSAALLVPPTEECESDDWVVYATDTRADGRRFAALVRDTRHYLEVNPHYGDDNPGLDAKIARQLRRIEDSVTADCGGIDSMQQVRAWFMRAEKRASRRPANGWAALTVLAGAIALFVWMIRLYK